MAALLLIAASLVAAAAGFLVWRGYRSKAENNYHFRCPGCGLKVRYSSASVGRRIHCPRCLRASTLNPYAPEPSRDRTSYRYRPYRLRRS